MKTFRCVLSLALLPTLLLALVSLAAAKETPSQTIEIAGGVLAFDAPQAWESIRPKSGILEKELSVPAPEGSEAKAARLTLMAAGGSVQANLSRWDGQFQGLAEGDTKTEKLTVDGMPATVRDLAGTFLESAGGPFGPKTPRPGYRMLGAIVETGSAGNYYFKLIGPAETVDPAAEGFRAMIESLRKKQ